MPGWWGRNQSGEWIAKGQFRGSIRVYPIHALANCKQVFRGLRNCAIRSVGVAASDRIGLPATSSAASNLLTQWPVSTDLSSRTVRFRTMLSSSHKGN